MKHELNDSHLTRCVDLEAMLTEASTEETDIDSVLFENLTLEGGSYPGLTFRGCKFVGCRLSGCSLERAAWIDMLEQCDLSNTQMIKGTMQRTKLTDCKLVGISLTEASLLDSSIERCVAVRQPLRLQDAPREADGLGLLQRRALRLHARHNVPLAVSAVRAELFGTLFHGMDLWIAISGISLSGGELRGAR